MLLKIHYKFTFFLKFFLTSPSRFYYLYRISVQSMKTVIQRCSQASVSIDNRTVSSIAKGMMILVGFQSDDTEEDLDWMVKKIVQLRIFDDESGVMNLGIREVGGDILVVSQFTLMASTKKGNRPSYILAAPPSISVPLYEQFKEKLSIQLEKPVSSGIFGADMQVALVNDGPVTILIDSKNKL